MGSARRGPAPATWRPHAVAPAPAHPDLRRRTSPLTVGGNNAGFAAVLTECAKPAWASNCNGAIDKAVSIIDNVLPAQLTCLSSAVRTPGAAHHGRRRGYPRVFNGEDCTAMTWFSPTEESRLAATADRLDSGIATAANVAGIDRTSRASIDAADRRYERLAAVR